MTPRRTRVSLPSGSVIVIVSARTCRRWPSDVPAAGSGRPAAIRGSCERRREQVDAEQRAELAQDGGRASVSSPPESIALGEVVERFERLRRVEIVVDRGAHARGERRGVGAVRALAPRRGAGAAARCPPRGRCRATRTRRGSGGASARGGWRAGRPPSAGRSRTRGCRATSTSSRPRSSPSPSASSGARTAAPVTLSLCAISHSWCGKIEVGPAAVEVDAWGRARPSPSPSTRCASRGDRRRTARATRARRASDGCHSTKSSGSRRCGSSGLPPRARARRIMCSAGSATARRSAGTSTTSKYTVPWVRYAWPASSSSPIHLDHAVDRLRGARLGDRRPHAERVHVGAEARELRLGELEVGHAELAGLRQDRVVDVGDVAHHAHLVAELLEPADEEVVGEVGRGVAEVGRVVRRDAADVHRDDGPGLERHDRPLRGVEDPRASSSFRGLDAARGGCSPVPCGGC